MEALSAVRVSPMSSSSSTQAASAASTSTAAAAPSSTSDASSKSHKRLSKELTSLQTSPPPYLVSVTLPTPSSLAQWHVLITGPPSTPYEGGRFSLLFVFPDAYPMRPPVVTFLTSIFHVNVDMKSSGAICQDIVSGGWSPVLRVADVLTRVYAMLSAPHLDTPLDAEIGEMAATQPKKYRDTAAQWTKKHATG